MSRTKKHSSIVTIFTAWNTMVGSGVVSMPYTFFHSGIVLGSIICFTSFLASLRTCIIIVRLVETRNEFYETMKDYWGPKGFYLSVISTMIIVQSAVTAYFVIMTQVFYQIILALLDWIFGVNLPINMGVAEFSTFS